MRVAAEEQVNVSAGLFIKGTESKIPLVGVLATADIVGRGAKVRIAQAFRNVETSPIEAVYRFPLSEGAAVCGFRARIGDRMVTGEIEDRDKAFEKYDEAMAEGHGAYLLDEERPNIFTVSVGNLRPGDEATVEIDYVELLSTHGGESRFFLPTTISPRYTPAGQPDEEDIPASEKVRPSGGILPRVPYGIEIRVDVHGKETVASVESPSHNIRQEFQEDRISVTLTSGTTKMDRDFVLTLTRKEEFRSCAYAFTGEKGTFLQADLAPEEESKKELRQARIFVIDSSGSMMGGSIEQANAALTAVLRGMKDGELFNVFRFGSQFEKIFSNPVPYSKETLEEALGKIGRVKNMGGTEILSVLNNACGQKVPEGYSLALFLLTDGQVSNEKEVVDFVGSQTGRLRVFSLGVGHGVNDFFIRGIARATGGASELVVSGERIEPKALRLYGKLCRGGIGELSLDGTNCGVTVPRRPVAYFGEAMSIFARLGAGPAPGTITMVGKTVGADGEAWSRILPVKVVPGNDLPMSTLWAREVIRDIEEGGGLSTGSRQQRRKQQSVEGKAAEISREFGVLCATTSFVAVDARKDGEKAKGGAELRKVPAMLTKDWGGIARRVDMSSGILPSMPKMAVRIACYAMDSNIGDVQSAPPSDVGRKFSRPIDADAPRALRYPSRRSGIMKTSRTDVLMNILSKQFSGGGFEIDDDLMKALGIPLSTVQRGVKSFHGAEGDLRGLLVGTALVLAVLEVRFADMVDQWGGLVVKSREWLKKQAAVQDLKVGRKGLVDWARDQVSKL